MQRHAKKGTGVSVKVLKESWKGSLDAILELEEQGKLLVIRAGKDNNPKFVFWNTVTPEQVEEQQIDQGALSCVISLYEKPVSLFRSEFKDMWHKQAVPEDADVLRALDSEGLAPTISTTIAAKPQPKKKARKATKSRPTRITNTHIQGVDLSMDYQPTPPS
jgi:transcription initiation factor TFIIE subunit beta